MRDTRKQLIELLEPYMEKDLSDGCLIYNIKYGFAQLQYGNKEVSLEGKMIALVDGKINWLTIGHYDISAVIKYINSFKFNTGISGNGDNILFSNEGFINNIQTFLIPNKPLYIYTEEEEKDLLELLKQLGIIK